MAFGKNDIITINESGDGGRVFIFSPAFPFSHKIFLNFSEIDLSETKFIFCDLNTSGSLHQSSYELQNFIDFYVKLIDTIDQDKEIYLVG
ncbi:MAG TPA: hypothetical protein PK771_09255, partial [Spirochaetota bacterium]|nr:hypothetical protein [Spirochaetota bacterium]